MRIGHRLGYASGPSWDNCHYLGFRFNEEHGFTPNESECYVLQNFGGQLHSLLRSTSWLTALWRSPSDRVYVCEAVGRVHINNDIRPKAAPWQAHALAGTISGIWGIDDDFVFAWGQGGGEKGILFFWDGKRWSEVDCPGLIVGMHGLSRNLVYAVGYQGLIAKREGNSWSHVPSPTSTGLSDVFIVSENEMYAVGPGRHLLQGSIFGWSDVLEFDGMLHAVAKFKGEVWVAAGIHGLFKLKGNVLEQEKVKFEPTKFDVRSSLLISCERDIVQTDDGKRFYGMSVARFEEAVRDNKPDGS